MTGLSAAVAHLRSLIACRSVTPADAGAQDYVAGVLERAGFAVSRLVFSAPDVADTPNLFATIGSGPPHLVFGGHTDVVPVGDEAGWRHPPFAGEVEAGEMFGRGAVDMKGGLAAFLAAAEDYLAAGARKGTLSLLVTGDEEGIAVNGTVRALAWALEQGHRFDAALIGEPTSRRQLGDTVKIGRRGSLSGTLTVLGRQGHVAYPHLADNPVPRLARIVDRLSRLTLDKGSDSFQPSNLEVVALDTDTRAFNVIPALARARFNVRFNDRWSVAGLKDLLAAELEAEGVGGAIAYEPGASEWFLTRADSLVAPLTEAIAEIAGLRPEMSTGGGTSDARFFRDVCPVVEFGLVGDTMHQADERVPLADLDALTAIYRRFLERYFAA